MNYLQKVAQAKRLIGDAIEKYPNIALGCSFGKDSMVTLHLVLSVKPDIPVFTILAETEFRETYMFINEVMALYGLNCAAYFFKQAAGEKCCGRPKVEKTIEALAGYDAWISGVRMTEGITRANFKPVEVVDGLAKINPILEFTELDIWRYTALNGLPINPKYREGYRSLGCALCSSPERDESESERDGRWPTDAANHGGECGIHTQSLRPLRDRGR